MHWNYFKYKFLLNMLNEYKIPAEGHQVVYSWAADEVSALEILFWEYLEYIHLILRNYKKIKECKN